jgi:hypothetical protein
MYAQTQIRAARDTLVNTGDLAPFALGRNSEDNRAR